MMSKAEKIWLTILGVFILIGLIEVIHVFWVGQIATGANDKIPWGLDVPVHIFLTGASAGSFIIATLALLGLPQFKSISRIAIIQAIVFILADPILLLVGMGRPERFWLIYFSPNPTSVISWGAYLFPIYVLCCILYGYYLMRRDMVKTPLTSDELIHDDKRARFFGLLGIPLAIMVHSYAGVLLGFVRGRILWQTPLMPVLFLTSAIVSGIALLIIVLLLLHKYTDIKITKETFSSLTKILIVTLLIDLFFVFCEILTGMYGRSGDHYEAWLLLMSGAYAPTFVVVQIILGALLPVVMLFYCKKNMKIVVTACVLVLIGVFIMRYNIIIGGQVIQAYGGPLGSYLPTLGECFLVTGLGAGVALLYTYAVKYLPLQSKAVVMEDKK